jgi:hypothetical protein
MGGPKGMLPIIVLSLSEVVAVTAATQNRGFRQETLGGSR